MTKRYLPPSHLTFSWEEEVSAFTVRNKKEVTSSLLVEHLLCSKPPSDKGRNFLRTELRGCFLEQSAEITDALHCDCIQWEIGCGQPGKRTGHAPEPHLYCLQGHLDDWSM